MGKTEVCIDDEIPFELPDGWAWARLSTVCEMYTGDSINETEKKKKYMGHTEGRFYIGTKDVGFDHVITYDNGVRIPYEEESRFRIAPSLSTLLCVEGGSAGRKIAMLNQAVCFGNKLCCFVPHSIDETYLYYYLQSPSFISVFKSNTTGIIGGVSINTLKGLLFAIPPLSEQHRIVKKLLLLSPFIAEYNEYEQAESLLNEELPTMLRKSILQYAIQGKLVPQDPTDEPASVLLERIRTERETANGGKKSKAKTESYIFKNSDDNSYYEKIGEKVVCIDEEIPFELPDGWVWTRVSDIVEICTGASFKKEEGTKNTNGVRVLRGGNILPGQFFFKDDDIFIDSALVKGNILLRKNDLITPAVSSIENIGKVARIDTEIPNTTAGGFVFIIRPIVDDDTFSQYLSIAFSNPYMVNSIQGITKKSGQAFYNIGKERLVRLLIPIAPHNEQLRIIKKIATLQEIASQ